MHKPIQLQDISLIYPHKTCFNAFSGQIHFGDRIAIIGCNGAGKSSLLKMLQGTLSPTHGHINRPQDINLGYLPQIIEDFPELSGAQRLNRLLSIALSSFPNVLLLDEPSNHLDSRNRRSLLRLLQHFRGTLVMVSHDVEFITGLTKNSLKQKDFLVH